MHLEKAWGATGRQPERLKIPPIPLAFERAMRVWQELHRNRPTGGMGLGGFTWPDFYAYSVMMRDPLSRDDIEAIRVIDDEFFASRAEAEERRSRAAAKATPKAPLSSPRRLGMGAARG